MNKLKINSPIAQKLQMNVDLQASFKHQNYIKHKPTENLHMYKQVKLQIIESTRIHLLSFR